MAAKADYLTSAEALRLLKIKPQTLYAYVSRGLIHALPAPDRRSSLYLRGDVERLAVKSAARAGLGAVAASAMRWGEPVITTGVTQITQAGPSYRGRLALDLARAGVPFETVVDFLWDGTWVERPSGWSAPDTPRQVVAQLAQAYRGTAHVHITQLLIVAVSLLGLAHGTVRARAESGVPAALLARQTMRTLAGAFGFIGPRRRFLAPVTGESLNTALARALGVAPNAQAIRAINALLVLDIDHELTSSTFAARIAASGGADLHCCIGAALNTHHSHLTGSRADRVEELFVQGASSAAVVQGVEKLLAAAEGVPGFNHPFYPKGDPRAALLIDIARELGGTRPAVRSMLRALEVLGERFALRPSFEFGAVALCRALGMPAQTASGFRSLARTAGWVAHVFEQRLAGFMIRPRAKYVGPPAN